MKIKINENVYLQKYEVAYIMHDLNSFPGSILKEIFGADKEGVFFMNDSSVDGFWFECVFRDPENAKWLMDQDWIVDYDEYAEMPTSELETLIEHLEVEYSADIKKFNAKDESYRKEHCKEVRDKFNKTGHKISSLGDLAKARKGKINFVFPDEYQGKTTPDLTSISKKKLSFFARLFGRSAQ